MNFRSLRLGLVAVLAVAGLYLSFELGRFNAGFSLLDSRRQDDASSAILAERDRTIDTLERRIAILETEQEIDQETYANVEGNLAELQQRIQEQEEELAFYRGIVTPGDGVSGLRIQNVGVDTGSDAATHVLRVLLVQAIVHNDRVTGSVRATLRGDSGGSEVEYDLGELGVENSATDIPYGFRYFQNLEVGLALPDGFVPAELEIQVWPRSPRGDTIVQSYAWSAILG